MAKQQAAVQLPGAAPCSPRNSFTHAPSKACLISEVAGSHLRGVGTLDSFTNSPPNTMDTWEGGGCREQQVQLHSPIAMKVHHRKGRRAAVTYTSHFPSRGT